MRKKFAISDTHFGHTKCWSTFKNADGTPLRPFTSDDEMDEHMIDAWNKVVGHDDIVYHLGDVVINRKFLWKVGRLNGHKRLVRGNHDIFPTKEYMQYFEEIYGVGVPNDNKTYPFIMSHIPLHPESVGERWLGNVHGHLHGKRVMNQWGNGRGNPDPRYICVSVENVNYTPVDFDEIVEQFKAK